MRNAIKMTLAAALGAASCVASAADVLVAVAANFTAPAKELAPIFEKQTGHKLMLSFGGTGMFYGQIKNGADFDVLLAADAKTPKKAIEEGYAVAGTSFTYAVGKLVLWSSDAQKITDAPALLKKVDFNKCAVANPKLAPYGLAAYEALKAMGIFEKVQPKFVEGDNIGKTFNFVSQVSKDGKLTSGSGWVVPEKYYNAIRQDAVLLKNGKNAEAAKEFLEFLKGPEAAKIKEAYGYGAG